MVSYTLVMNATFSSLIQCNVGWAGNGNTCGPDIDIDGYPDENLPCIDNDKHCKAVCAALIPSHLPGRCILWRPIVVCDGSLDTVIAKFVTLLTFLVFP